jgi:hypothetical protein
LRKACRYCTDDWQSIDRTTWQFVSEIGSLSVLGCGGSSHRFSVRAEYYEEPKLAGRARLALSRWLCQWAIVEIERKAAAAVAALQGASRNLDP